MAAKGGESRTGLVVFLVLFVLLSIGLGVTTYYGYDAADKAAKDKAEADKKAKAWEDDSNWYHSLADTYRVYIGFPAPAGDEVATMRTQYGNGNGAKDKPKADDHKKIVETLDKDLKWDETLKKPALTYQEEIDQLKKKLGDSQTALTKANKERDDANALAEANKRELDKARADYVAKLNKQKEDNDLALKEKNKTIDDQQATIDEYGKKQLASLDGLKGDNEKLTKANQGLTRQLSNATKALKDRADEQARSQALADIDVSKISPDSLAKIVSINDTGDMPYINLGSADNLKRQVTFSVFGKGVDGKPLKEPKGKIEVIRVAGEHLAQTRITELRDERRDPILPGDFIYNPAWNPNVKQHVAIVGLIDLGGDHRDSVQEFIRMLKNQNVDVDAYMDMRTKKLLNAAGDGPGEITRRTDLLIVGEAPKFAAGVIKVGDAKAQAADEALQKMQDYQKDAESKGVRIVRLSTFLEMSGYPLPRPIAGEGGGKIDFHRNLEAAGSPVERKDKPK